MEKHLLLSHNDVDFLLKIPRKHFHHDHHILRKMNIWATSQIIYVRALLYLE